MSTNQDLMKLYSQRILALAADVPYHTRLNVPDITITKRSPLCGSTVTVDVSLDDEGWVAAFGQDVKACALGQASAAVFASEVIGRSFAEIQAARDELKAMLREQAEPPAAPFDGYETLLPARDYRNRHASILLVPDATAEAMEELLTKKIAATP